MARSYPLNPSQPGKLPTVWRSFIRPMLILSVGIHAIALWVPLPEKAVDPQKVAQQAITISQLPPQDQASTAKPVTSAKPAVPPRPATRALIARTSTSPIARSRPASAAVPASAPASPSTLVQPSAPVSTNPSASRPTADAFLNDFPQYPGSQPGSFGLPPSYDALSHKTPDAIDAVDTWFQQQLPRQGFALEPVEQSSQQMVYRISKGGITQFLSLVPNAAGGTNILVIPDPLQGSSEQASLPSRDVKFATDLEGILPTQTTSGWQAIGNASELLAEPNAFFEGTTLKLGGETAVYGENQTVDTVFTELRSKFQAAEIEVIRQGDYGGGGFYQLIRGSASRYMSLVPSKDGKSTVIVVWSRSPLE